MGVQLREALSITEDPLVPFSIKFVSYDAGRKTGGEIITLPRCTRTGANHNRKKNDTTVVKPIDRVSHPYVVHNHLILEVNEMEVFI